MKDYREELTCTLGDPCDYDHTCKNHRILGDMKSDYLAALDAALKEKIPEDVRSFIYTVTLFLQASRYQTPQQMDTMFQRAYKLYDKYDVEGLKAKAALRPE